MMTDENRQKVARRFQKYPRWQHPTTGEWLPQTEHPLDSVLRGVLRHSPFPIDPGWENDGGRAKFFAYVREQVPVRPSQYHWLSPVDPRIGFKPGNLRWEFRLPKLRRGERFQPLDVVRWMGAPEAEIWERYGGALLPERVVLMPERDLVAEHLDRKWRYFDDCLCTDLDYWPDCHCGLAMSKRF